MNKKEKENEKSQFEQLQKLGEVLNILQLLNLDELESITTGSYLGKAVELLKNVQKNLNLDDELKEDEDIIADNLVVFQDKLKPLNQPNKESDYKKVFVDYLQKVFSDTEEFPDRKSIIKFFQENFNLECEARKSSRTHLISKLARLLLDKNISREEVGEALLKATNFKHGSLLKEKEPSFLKSWYEAIERM
ncbi:MAG: hypothetical protein RID09_25915 [Coleofasciculus sp. G1-WW12-02]|uniref:hypothetical protein n=1 Tax=Coleofasciculus sp. G1-WW12-02 TaxID=3068483 RepID=UPI0033002425